MSMAAGDTEIPVLYQVERTRDGRSFSLRSVTATQYGRPILICQVSFHIPQESPVQHRPTMPEVPQPEELLTADELFTLHFSKPDLAENAKLTHTRKLSKAFPFEVKPVDQSFFIEPAAREPRMLLWLRSRGHLGEGLMNLHCCVAAYVSDFLFRETTLLPYPDYKTQFYASLNHAMWFHSTFRSDEWMLYECESPWAGNSRGLVHGRLWRRDGGLAASCSQEHEAVLRITLC